MSNNFSIFYLKAQLEVNFFLAEVTPFDISSWKPASFRTGGSSPCLPLTELENVIPVWLAGLRRAEEELGAVVAVELPDQDEGEEDDVDGDPHQGGCVVGVGGDGLQSGGLAELVLSCVGSDLEKTMHNEER